MTALNRRDFIRTAGVASVLGAAVNPQSLMANSKPAASKPNVLFIWTDQQTASAMSNAGNADLRTPAMDSMARDGVSFERAYCSDPICVPARTSWITGRMPHETGVTFNTNDPGVAVPAISRQMKAHGYDTGYVGKWHIPHDVQDRDWHGFDYLGNIKNNGIDPQLPRECETFLRQERDRPFFLVASFINPHDICEWARKLAGLKQELPNGELPPPPAMADCPPLPANFGIPEEEPEVIRELQALASAKTYPTQGWDEAKWRQYLWGYYRLIEKVDAQIGQVLATLKAVGADRDTLIIFSSDHGDGAGAHAWNQKTLFYDECARVPFIVRPPGGAGMARRDARNLVNATLDFFPTVFDYAGIPWDENLEGRSVRALVENRAGAKGQSFVISQNDLAPDYGKSGGVRGRMLRSSRYKYVRYSRGANNEQLFDLDLDPGEMRDLKHDPAHASILREHREGLDAWMKRTGDSWGEV